MYWARSVVSGKVNAYSRGGLTHEHVIADVVVRADVFARVRDGVHDVRAEPDLGHARHDAREQGVIERRQLRAVCQEYLRARRVSATLTAPERKQTYQEDLRKIITVYFAVHVRLREAEVAHRAEPQPEDGVAHGELGLGRFEGVRIGVDPTVHIAVFAEAVRAVGGVDGERPVGDVLEQPVARDVSAVTRASGSGTHPVAAFSATAQSGAFTYEDEDATRELTRLLMVVQRREGGSGVATGRRRGFVANGLPERAEAALACAVASIADGVPQSLRTAVTEPGERIAL